MTQTHSVEAFVALAVKSVSAAQANEQIARMREEFLEGHSSLSYEWLWPSSECTTPLLEKAAQQLIYFLDCRGVKIPAVTTVFVSLFVGESLHFIPARAFLEQLSAELQMPLPEMVKKWGQAGDEANPKRLE